MLTPEQESDLRRFVERHPDGGDRYTVTTFAAAELLKEIDRLRTENEALRAKLHIEAAWGDRSEASGPQTPSDDADQ